MTKAEFNEVFAILKGECFVSAEDIQVWIDAIKGLDYEDTMRNIQQYRDARKYNLRIVPVPSDVAYEVKHYHGFDKYQWMVLQAIKEEADEQFAPSDDD